MVFKRFTIAISALIILMAASMFLFFWSLEVEYLKFTVYGFAFTTFLIAWLIIRLVIKNNMQINRFLENYIVNEGSPKFTSSFKGKSFKLIEENLNRISRLYGKVKTDKEAEHVFLQQLIDELKVGILVYDESGAVTLNNRTVLRMLGLHSLNQIKLIKPKNEQIHQSLSSGVKKNPTIVRLWRNQEKILLSISITQFVIQSQPFNLALFQDVTNEMSQEEVGSWQKLIKILRHEIINSLTPITTLTSTLLDNFDEINYQAAFEGEYLKTLETNYKGLRAIDKRSRGLTDFIKGYKELSDTLKPKLSEVKVEVLFNHLSELVSADLRKKDIKLNIKVENKAASLLVDERQITQVLINLVKNAIEAMSQTAIPQITISHNNVDNLSFIEVKDNGVGIKAEELEKIFIPFYTTKKEGSGIGLSLSKQIMHLHKGDLKVLSRDKETFFRLEF